MATSRSNSFSGMMSDYAHLRTIPAMLGIVFALSSLYQFGGIATVELTWLDYTLTAQHSMLVSLGTMLVAFASSETRDFDMYEDWEMIGIAAAPVLIIGTQYVTEIEDIVLNSGDMVAMAAFLVTVGSWGIAVR